MFVDQVRISLKAGNGGKGAVAFHREKFIDKGGPAGGDGGRGGSIYFEADSGLSTLLDFKYRRKIEAKNGEDGQKEKRYGKAAEDVIVRVPVGTIVINAETKRIVADLKEPHQRALICKGGRGGRGNAKFATPTIRVPRIAENGKIGEGFDALLELKLLADVGLVGMPSVGKSTLINAVSSCKAEVGDYPFTTLIPNLGMVKQGDDSFVIADLPGLIEGASLGKGLGLQFLRHIERCKVLVHVLDMSDPNVIENYETINNELKSYKIQLLDKPMIVVANKMDLEESKENLAKFKKKHKGMEVIEISSLQRQNLDKLLYKCVDLVKNTKEVELMNDYISDSFFYKLDSKKKEEFSITHPSKDLWIVEGESLDKIFTNINLQDEHSHLYLYHKIVELGVEDKLVEKGIQDGDTVIVGDFEFVYYK